MTTKHEKKLRDAKFREQNGRCHYCREAMCNEPLAAFAKCHGLTRKQAKLRRVTLEHVIARCDGGKSTRGNVVAACLRCNQSRHQGRVARSADEHFAYVQHCVALGTWWAMPTKLLRPALPLA